MPKQMTRGQWLAGIFAAIGMAQEKTKTVNSEELEKLLHDEKNLFLLDVREPKEIEDYGSLKGYVNIPLGQLESRLKEVPKDKVILTMCERAGRAGRAADLLTKNGYKVVAACGLKDWREKKKPVVFPPK